MNCYKNEKYLAAYADGQLKNWVIRWVLKKHLKKCKNCRKTLTIQREVKQLLRQRISRIETPQQLNTRIKKQLENILYQE